MQKGFAQPLLILVILTFILLGGFGAYSLIATSTPNVSTFEEYKDQSFFKEYKDQSLGFSFRYAKHLAMSQDSEEEFNKRGNGNFRKNFKGYVMYEPGKVLGAVAVLDKTGAFDLAPFSVWVFDNSEQLSNSQWFEKYWFYPFIWGVFTEPDKDHIRPESIATVSGQTTKFAVASYQPGSPKYLYLTSNKKIYLVRIIGSEGDKILQSFEF